MVNDVLKDLQANLDKGIDALKKDLGKVRTGRANVAILDGDSAAAAVDSTAAAVDSTAAVVDSTAAVTAADVADKVAVRV